MSYRLRKKSLYDAYRFPGFTPARELKGVFGDPKARVLRLNRRSKKQFAVAAELLIAAGTTKKRDKREISRVATIKSTWSLKSAELIARSAKP